MAIEARNRALPAWLNKVQTHELVLPRFQRYEAWGHDRITQLFNTILRDLPVGAALVLEIGDEEPFISRPLKGAPGNSNRVTEHLLDGQQRLTALWRGLHNNYDDATYFLVLDKDEETGMPYYVETQVRWKQDRDREFRPFWANDPAQQWKRRKIPLDMFLPDINAISRFNEWSKAAVEDAAERDRISLEVQLIREKFLSFNLPFLSLPTRTSKETALDVFIKMNTSAASLSTYDIVVAQVEAGLGQSLHDLVADTRESCPSIDNYYPPEDLVLYASALLQERAPTNATFMARDFSRRLMTTWDTFQKGLPRAVAFLEEERVFDAARLPSDVTIPVLTALWAVAPEGLDAEGRARALLRK
jgi:hypothetical protein